MRGHATRKHNSCKFAFAYTIGLSLCTRIRHAWHAVDFDAEQHKSRVPWICFDVFLLKKNGRRPRKNEAQRSGLKRWDRKNKVTGKLPSAPEWFPSSHLRGHIMI